MMFWIMCAILFFAGSIVTVFLMSCLAIAQRADEQSERAYSELAGENTAQYKLF
jgi:hypothetical protein